jgi:hypothetical protein
MLFVNALERFNDLKGSKGIIEYINIDARSYQNYVNKARIFDLFEKHNVVLEFNNFERILKWIGIREEDIEGLKIWSEMTEKEQLDYIVHRKQKFYDGL